MLKERRGMKEKLRHSRGNMGAVSDSGFCIKGTNQSEGSSGKKEKKICGDFCLRQKKTWGGHDKK